MIAKLAYNFPDYKLYVWGKEPLMVVICKLKNMSLTVGDTLSNDTSSSRSYFVEEAFCRLGTVSKDGFVEHFQR